MFTNSTQHSNVGSRKIDAHRGECRGDVSVQWFSRPDDQKFTSLVDLRDHVRRQREISEEIVRAANLLSFEAVQGAEGEELAFAFDGERFEPTAWTFDQMTSLLGTPRDYMRRLVAGGAADLAALCLTQGVVDRGEKEVMVYRTPTEVRGITSPSYGRIYGGPTTPSRIPLANPATSPLNLIGKIESWGIGPATRVADVSIKVSAATGAQLKELLRKLPEGMTFELNLEKEGD